MPDFYAPGEYDLAGFCVGMVDRSNIVDGSKMKPGDVVLGLASSGLHSNGFSLVRKVLIERCAYKMDTHLPELGRPLGCRVAYSHYHLCKADSGSAKGRSNFRDGSHHRWRLHRQYSQSRAGFMQCNHKERLLANTGHFRSDSSRGAAG